MGKGSQIILPFVTDYPRIRKIQIRIIVVKPEDYDLTMFVKDGDTCHSGFLNRPFSQAKQKECFSPEFENPWVEQAFNMHHF
jgi:hypothetical protein